VCYADNCARLQRMTNTNDIQRPDNDPDNMPSPQEIMTVVQAGSDSTVAFKTVRKKERERERASEKEKRFLKEREVHTHTRAHTHSYHPYCAMPFKFDVLNILRAAVV